jgi:kinesin family member C2/C3
LAGSENTQKSGTLDCEESLRESSHVNKSLSALGDVMESLASKRNFIPFRNSKLTHYLQDSLSGESKVLMLIHISPLSKSISETNFTLNFGSKVNKIIQNK